MNGDVLKVQPFSYAETDEPIATTIGGGFQQTLGRRLAVRADAQLVTLLWLPLGVRFSAGVSIPFGQGYARN